MKRLVLLIAPIIILSCSTEENKTLIVDKEVEDVFKRNVKYWSDSNYEKITEEVYASPMAIYLRDSTIMLNSKAEVKNYLISIFDELERNKNDYFAFATMGGGSKLRGVEYGEFDHFMFITITEKGPYFSNLMSDGIEDKNIRKENN